MEQRKNSGLGIAGMILGIVSVVLSCVAIGFATAFVGLILSLFAIVKNDSKKGCAIAGISLNASAILLFILFIIGFQAEQKTDATNSLEQTEYSSPAETNTPEPTPIPTPEPTETPTPYICCEIDNCSLEYLKHEKVSVWGDECVVIYYQFTNNSSENKTFGYTVDVNAFQNGISLDESFFDLDNQNSEQYTEIKPNASIEVYTIFVLRDNSEILLEVNEMFSFDSKIIDEMTISLE